MTSKLSGQTALVTGAGRGIGRAIAERLGQAGMRTALVSRTESELQEVAQAIGRAGGEALVLPADVLLPETVHRAVAQVHERWGRLDLVVNNAGVLGSIGPLWETDPGEWRNDLQVNVLGVYNGCRYAVPVMMEQGSGRIVNLVGGGTHRPFPYVSAYAAGKSAVMRLTENLAVELDRAESPVRVFAMTPGFIPTRMTEQFARTERGRRWMDFMAERLEKGDHTTPDHAASLVAAIATGDLDAFHGRFLSAPHDAPGLQDLLAEGEQIAANGSTDRLLRVLGRDP